ncbi:MAG: hypothetical protein M0T75_08820 [Chloroflexi bacterium]|nr:hypothetical protein [Chloroflexota bacterium]
MTVVATTLDLVLPTVLRAASPSAAAPPGGDPRSSGEGPGFVGDPATAILVVLAIGLGSAVATALYVRLTRRTHG